MKFKDIPIGAKYSPYGRKDYTPRVKIKPIIINGEELNAIYEDVSKLDGTKVNFFFQKENYDFGVLE